MDDLKNIAPKLSKIKREVPFKVPNGYFEQFPDRLKKRIKKGASENSSSSQSIDILAPNLSKITKEVPFKAPDRYFEKFSERLNRRIQEGTSEKSTNSESIEIFAPTLSKITRKAPFRAPDRYFEKFPERLNTRIQEGTSGKSSSGRTIIRVLKPVIGLAASIILIFMLVYWPLNRLNMNNLAQSEADITEYNELDEYFSLISELDDNTFYSLMEGTYEEESFTDDELFSYINRSFNEYEIYFLAENLQ